MATLPPNWATLSYAEKWETVELMLESMKQEDNEPISEEFRQELVQRLEAHERNPERAIPWEVLKAELMDEQ
jgi:putative addiction module component (TIGR02574 family)